MAKTPCCGVELDLSQFPEKFTQFTTDCHGCGEVLIVSLKDSPCLKTMSEHFQEMLGVATFESMEL